MNDIEQFKKAFFDLPSRAFGETYVQEILYKILGDEKFNGDENNKSNIFDAHRGNLRGEYKAVRVVFENECGDTMYGKILNCTPMSSRIGTIQDIKSGKIISNFQNIKLNPNGTFDFDYLVYVLVDNDGFHIFEITGDDMKRHVQNKCFPSWCDKHGSKETGKNGQFPIRRENIDWHMKNNHKQDVSWQEILDLCKNIPVKHKKEKL